MRSGYLKMGLFLAVLSGWGQGALRAEEAIVERLRAMGQEHLLQDFERLSVEQKRGFLGQLAPYNAKTLEMQRRCLSQTHPSEGSFSPLSRYGRAGSEENRRLGEVLIASGKVGCLILAGGQASRLKSVVPKGTVSVSPIRGRSLFQLFFERAAAAEKRGVAKLPIAVMTSPSNHSDTEVYFKEHNWFGLTESQVDLFSQKMLPFVDDLGNWILEAPGKIAEGPDGNGGALQVFFDSGIWQKWKDLGVEYVNVVVVDNALADPFDAELMGFQEKEGAEVVLKCVERKNAEEKMGILVEKNKKVCVVEYSELSDQAFAGKNGDGSLRYSLANTSLFGLRMDWIGRIAQDPSTVLPWHLARKSAKALSGEIMVFKYEAFIFDAFSFAHKISVLLYPRKECFAPLKNASGENSLQTVQQALLNFDKEVFERISGTPAPERAFELDPAFYYPTEDLLARWRGRFLPENSYIQP
jgi:UDP-N-acetylglucosamine/UDP-N-acetylgalactosamine diphosphorylase